MATNTTQAIIEFIPDTRKVESAIQELSRSGVVTDGAATAFKEGNAALDKRIGLLKDNNAIMSAVQKGTSAIAGELIKATAAIDKMSAALENTDKAAEKMGTLRKMIQGVAITLGIMESALKLAGIENERLNAAISKVQTAISILNGLQELNTLINGKNAVSLSTTIRLQLIRNAQVAIGNGLQSSSAVVKKLAAAAQWALNAAMAANPAGILIVGIAALTTALLLFTQTSEDAAEAQKHLSEAEMANFNALMNTAKLYNANADKAILKAERELQLAKARGASTSEIHAMEEKLGRLRESRALRTKAFFAQEISQADQYKEKLFELYSEQSVLAGLTDEDSKNEKDAVDAQIANYQGRLDAVTAMEDDYTNVVTENQARRAEYDQKMNDASRRSHKGYMEARLAQSKEGSAQELNARVNVMLAERQIELANVNLTEGERRAIVAKSARAITDIKKQYREEEDRKDADANMQRANNMLAAAEVTWGTYSDQAIAAKDGVLTAQAAMDILAVKQSTDTEAQKALRILRINEKLAIDILAVDQEVSKHKLEEAMNYEDAMRGLMTGRLKNKAEDPTLNESQKFKAQQEVRIQEYADMKTKELELTKKHNIDKNYSDKQYQADMTRLTTEEEAKRAEIEHAYAERRKELQKKLADAGFQILNEAANAYFEADKAKRDAALEESLGALERQKEAELSKKGLTEEQKNAIEKKYAAQTKKLKTDAAKKDKEASKTQAIISGALAVVQAFAQMGPIAGAIAAAVIVATTAIQIAKINATPIPQFAKGTKNAPRGMAWVGEEGPELVRLNGGEAIYTARQSQHIYDQWAANIPTNSADMMSAYMVDSKGGLQIDYNKLGKAVAEHIPASTIVQNTIDSDGLHSFVLKAGSRTEVRNRRYGG